MSTTIIGIPVHALKITGIIVSIPLTAFIWFVLMVPFLESIIIRLIHTQNSKRPKLKNVILPVKWGLRFSYFFIFVATILLLIASLDLWGENMVIGGSLFAGTIGVASIGLFRSHIFNSFFSGILLMLRGYFNEGDEVEITGEYGVKIHCTVSVIGMHSTHFVDKSGVEYTIDNGKLLDRIEHVTNYSRSPFKFLTVKVETDQGHVNRILNVLRKRKTIDELIYSSGDYNWYNEMFPMPLPEDDDSIPSFIPRLRNSKTILNPKAWEEIIIPHEVRSLHDVIKANSNIHYIQLPYRESEEIEEIYQVIENIVTDSKVAKKQKEVTANE